MRTLNYKLLLGIALLGGGLASCSVDENVPSSAEENYTREFIKQFGLNISNEGMNVVEQKSVHVKCSKPSYVQISELQGGEYRLAANYDNVTDQTITFDGVKGDNSPYIVSCDGAKFYAENGGTVTYNAQGATTRAAAKAPLKSSAIPNEYSSVVTRSDNYTTITCELDDKTFKTLSEGNGMDKTEIFTVLSESNYIAAAEGSSFTFYPAYWNSPKKHTVGVYFYNKDGMHRIPFWSDKEGDDLQFKVNGNWTTTVEGATNCFDYGDAGKVTWAAGFTFNSKGYTFTAYESIIAGLYVQIGNKIYYSDKALNDGKNYFAYRTLGNNSKAYSFLCFDDPSDDGGEGDKDFNDLVVYLPQKVTPISLQSLGWTVACEDLGGTFDFDFNDVVFQVYHVSGNKWISVVPLAAGGTLPAKLQINRNDQWWDVSKEWHSHFGATEDTYNSGEMINTCFNGANYERTVWPIKVNLSNSNFSMAAYATGLDNAGRFRLMVKHNGKTWESVNLPGKDERPQILVLPVDWRWPKELKRINTIYPTFGDWGDGYSQGKTNNWVNNIQNSEDLTEDNFYKNLVSRGTAYEPPTE